MALGILVACSAEEPEGGRFDEGGSSGALCDVMADAVGRCGGSECEDALAADCSVLEQVFSDSFASALEQCLASGSSLAACLPDAAEESDATEAHAAFATAFCAECAADMTGCHDMFGALPPEPLRPVRAALLALDEQLVVDITDTCTSGLTCAAEFATCAQGVLAKRALPEESVACALEMLMSPSSSAPDCTTSSSSSSASLATSSSSSGSGGSGGTGGTGGSGGTATCDNLDSEPNDSESSFVSLGTLLDCDGAADVGGTLDGPGDADWYRFTGYDDYCWAAPTIDVMPGARVCMFFECLAGNTEVTCPTGATAANSNEGRPGCCATSSLSVSGLNCTGTINDDASVYVRIDDPQATTGSCDEYTLTYEY